MSVITESLQNEPIVIISNFVACKHNEQFDWEKSREFNIGDIVYFLDAFEDKNTKQEHLKWFVKFRTEEGDIYSATQLYFVVMDEWEDIIEYAKKI